jgi:hypothetical protein
MCLPSAWWTLKSALEVHFDMSYIIDRVPVAREVQGTERVYRTAFIDCKTNRSGQGRSMLGLPISMRLVVFTVRLRLMFGAIRERQWHARTETWRQPLPCAGCFAR